MGMGSHRRVVVVMVALVMVLLVLVVANVCLGSVPLALGDVVRVLLGGNAEGVASQVIWSIRLPRLVGAGLLGGSLALSGLLLQAFFNNPIAGPYVLGISSGAKLAVALVMVVGVGAMGVLSSWMLVFAATVGSLGVTCLVLLASRRVRSASLLVVTGVMIGYVCSAATDFVITFAGDASIVNLRNWSQGSFSGLNWHDVGIVVPVVLLAATCVWGLAKPLGAYALGEGYAQSMGVPVRPFRVAIIVLSSVLAACATAFAGPVSFVGVAVPHVTRRMLGTSKPLFAIPAAFVGGAAFCLLADLVARTLFAPTELLVSTVTAILGAPVVIWVLLDRKGRVS